MIEYDYRPGMPFLKAFKGGRMFRQVFCAPVGESACLLPTSTNEIISAEGKRCLLQLVVLIESVSYITVLNEDLAGVDSFSEGELSAE